MSPRRETGIDEIRRVARVLEHCSEGALDALTAEELLRLVRACWASEWDVLPDMLNARQMAEAIANGAVPEFREDSQGGLHALPVCECGRCARAAERAGAS